MSRITTSGAVRQRDPRQRDRPYLEWIGQLPCVACLARRGSMRWGVQRAHVKIGYPEDGWRAFGHAEKAHDWRTVPLCADCHQHGFDAQHRNVGGDERDWWERLGVHPPALCDALRNAYEQKRSGVEIIRKFAYESHRSKCES